MTQFGAGVGLKSEFVVASLVMRYVWSKLVDPSLELAMVQAVMELRVTGASIMLGYVCSLRL